MLSAALSLDQRLNERLYLDALVNPGLTHAPAPAPGAVPLDPLTLRKRVQAAYPELACTRRSPTTRSSSIR